MRARNSDGIRRMLDGEVDHVDVVTRWREGARRAVAFRLERAPAMGVVKVIDVAGRTYNDGGMIMAAPVVGEISRCRSGGRTVWYARQLDFDRWIGCGDHDNVIAAGEAIFREVPPRAAAADDGQPVAYVVQCGGVFYERRKDGGPISLVEAMRDSYGVMGRTIYRIGPCGQLIPVVKDAGSSYAVTYAGTGKQIRRRVRAYIGIRRSI